MTHLFEKIRAHHAYQWSMYRAKSQPNMPDFFLPFGGKLDPQNRWIKLAAFVPWNMMEGEYEKNFASSGMGAPALTCRIALGSLIINDRLGLTDEETAQNILENPYLQYFLGLHECLRDSLFDPSMMVHFRKRITPEMVERVNQAIIDKARGIENNPPHPPQTHVSPEGKASDETPAPAPTQDAPKGKLVIDATATPADIIYPTDLKILNEAREKNERIIDKLHGTMLDGGPKPRTYRQKARRDFLNIALSKKPRANKIRTAIGKQLRDIKRNLGHIHNMLDNGVDLVVVAGASNAVAVAAKSPTNPQVFASLMLALGDGFRDLVALPHTAVECLQAAYGFHAVFRLVAIEEPAAGFLICAAVATGV
jgi:transposase, IS5 family